MTNGAQPHLTPETKIVQKREDKKVGRPGTPRKEEASRSAKRR
jgi:hypothetical protein